MQTAPRGKQPIELGVFHTNEGPEGKRSARGLAAYLKKIDGGYNDIVDDTETIHVADDDIVVWGAGGVNERAIHLCLIGYASQTAAQWADPYSTAEIDRAAAWAAQKSTQHGLPLVHLTPGQVATAGVKGFCTHGDVSVRHPASEGHTDPGEGFPFSLVMEKARGLVDPPVATLRNPHGGMWIGYGSGRVDFRHKGVTVHGGMVRPADVAAFAGRTLDYLTLRWYRKRLILRPGYTIHATSGETYIPSGQH
jgi:hypothetical protein